MHTLTADSDISLGPVHMKAGVSYAVEDINAGEIMAASDAKFTCHPWNTFHPWNDPMLHLCGGPEGSACFVLPGGFGDMVFLTAVLERWRELHPGAQIAVSSFEQVSCILVGQPVTWLNYPFDISQARHFERIICMERCVQDSPGVPAVDAMAERAGLAFNNDDQKRSRYVVLPEESAWAAEALDKETSTTGLTPKTKVGIQVRASAMCRTYPLMSDLIVGLLKRDCWVHLFGAPGEIELAETHPMVVNWSERGLSFRQSAALWSLMDGVIAPDSAFCHVAGALGLPTVALYGPFKWQERTAYHPNIYGINGAAPCAPCHHHVRAGIQWPSAELVPNAGCHKTNYCTALANIPPERVVSKILNQIQDHC